MLVPVLVSPAACLRTIAATLDVVTSVCRPMVVQVAGAASGGISEAGIQVTREVEGMLGEGEGENTGTQAGSGHGARRS